MDDISSAISNFLSDDNNVKQLQSVMASLGMSDNNSDSDSNNSNNSNNSSSNNVQNNVMSQLAGLLSSPQQESAPPAPQLPDISKFMQIQKIFSSLSKEDDNILLLRALKPHLKEKNRKKVDDAIKIMQLISVLPLIKESGLFGGDLF